MANVDPVGSELLGLPVAEAIACLADPDRRADAQRVLLGAGESAVPALLRALAEVDAAAAWTMVEVLGLLGDLRAVSPLRRLLRRTEAELARAAAEALGHIPHGAAVWALRDGLASAHQTVRIEAILSLARHAASEEALLAAAAEATLVAMAPDDVGAVVEALLWRLSPQARDAAFARAIRVDAAAAVEAVLPLLRQQSTAQSARDALRRVEAVHPLIFRLDAGSAADILPVLADIGCHLQPGAAAGAPSSDGGRVETALLDIVTTLTNWYDPDEPALADLVVDGLWALGDYAITVLRARLESADADERPYLIALLRALEWQPTDDASGLPYLLAAGEWERVAALGPVAIEPLLAELDGPDLRRRDSAALALARLGWQPADRVMEYRLAIALGRWDALPRRDAAARTLLLSALAEERAAARPAPDGGDGRVPRRVAIVRALARFPAAAATRGLLAALRDDRSSPVREEAARALEGKGRDAIPLIAEALAHEGAAEGNEASFRRDLIHLLARLGGHARGTAGLLRRLAGGDPSPLVRDAARAAVARIDGRAGRPPRQPLADALAGGDSASPHLSLRPHAAAEVGQALRSGRYATPEDLARLLDSGDAARVGRAAATLVAMGRAGSSVLAPLEEVLLTGSPSGRRAAAQALDRLGVRPARPEALAAYHLVRGDLAACEALGEPARIVLTEALPLLDWRSAGAVAISLLRLGEPLWSSPLSSVIDFLEQVATLPDGRVDETLLGDDRRPTGARAVSLTVSRAADRRAARELLAALQAEARRQFDGRGAPRHSTPRAEARR